jgi:DNA-binding XRE family transcriptional regulator
VFVLAYKVGKCLLQKYRIQKRWTQQELADRIHKTKQAVHRWEDNKGIMSYESALALSKVLGIQMEDLYEIIEVEE